MKRMTKAIALPLLSLALTGLPAFAQDHPDQDRHDNSAYKQHDEWKRGAQISKDDWNRGEKVDYHKSHLKPPPAGHEWRKIDGNYVMAKDDGTIASVRPAPRNHQRSPDQHPQ